MNDNSKVRKKMYLNLMTPIPSEDAIIPALKTMNGVRGTSYRHPRAIIRAENPVHGMGSEWFYYYEPLNFTGTADIEIAVYAKSNERDMFSRWIDSTKTPILGVEAACRLQSRMGKIFPLHSQYLDEKSLKPYKSMEHLITHFVHEVKAWITLTS